MPAKLRVYSCLQDMYERYTAREIAETLVFEKHRYRLVGECQKGGIYMHLYHCESEQHYVWIHLRSNMPFLIKTFYSVREIKISDLQQDLTFLN